MSAEKRSPSKMAEGIALHRADESRKPEGERIFYDPYAFRFVDPATLAFAARHSAKKACYKGANENRPVCDLLYFAHAEVR